MKTLTLKLFIAISFGLLCSFSTYATTSTKPEATTQTKITKGKIDTKKEQSANVANTKTEQVKTDKNKTANETENSNNEDLLSSEEPTTVKDPYESFNRASFRMNEDLDKWILKPAARGYNTITPNFINSGIHNMFLNIETWPTVINDILQANFYQTISDSWRLVINTTVGVFGFFDVATHMGLPYNKEDFGLTMAKWGYTNSDYVVMPFWGPKTVRDVIAMPFNYYFSIYPWIKNLWYRYGLYGFSIIDWRAQLLQYSKVYEELAIDPYVFLRSAYLQNRNYEIERNKELDDPYTPQDMQAFQEDYYLDE